MNRDSPHILLINPWIHDFAAYDFWAKPLGILMLAAILKQHGFKVSYIDCLNRFHPAAPPTDPSARYGRGPYLKTPIHKPEVLADVPRNFSRYGILPEWLRQDLQTLPYPDLILVTSLMTYWYPGVQETIGVLRQAFPDVTVVLGGIYATLCNAHGSRHSGADEIFAGPGEESVLQLCEKHTGFSTNLQFNPDDLNTYPYPAFELQTEISYVPIQTSRGCPFQCAYCASHVLNPQRMQRSPEGVVEELQYWHAKFQVNDFAFYDDALLMNAETHAIPLFEAIILSGLKVRLHTPNAVHIRGISQETANLMFDSGFKTLRLGLETAFFGDREKIDRKVTQDEFMRAVSCLKSAGFKKEQVGAYLLAGLPGQTIDSVADSIKTVNESKITPIPAYYSPIPHTALWPRAVASSRYDLESDPIYTNNAIFPCQRRPFSWETVTYLKNAIREISG
ncbi:B12-binding domain-containing radical SAM protein [Thermodesulfobacteriota bacterium]